MQDLLSYELIFLQLVEYISPVGQPHQFDSERTRVAGRIIKDLRKREAAIQDKIIASMPLMKFSQVEPSLTKKFDAKSNGAIVRQ